MTEQVPLRNSQQRISRICWISAFIFAMTTLAVFLDGTPVSGFWALGLIGIFLTLSALVCGLLFASRAKKMAQLLSGEKLLARWSLDDGMLREYVVLQKDASGAKNKAIMILVTILFVIVTIPFLFALESDERLGFVLIMASLLTIVFIASRFFPWYYQARNLRGDRQVLIGARYAYINGYLHNWDFPLSGLKDAKVMKRPFQGISIIYYYTDRTFKHTHELKIPAPADLDVPGLVTKLRSAS